MLLRHNCSQTKPARIYMFPSLIASSLLQSQLLWASSTIRNFLALITSTRLCHLIGQTMAECGNHRISSHSLQTSPSRRCHVTVMDTMLDNTTAFLSIKILSRSAVLMGQERAAQEKHLRALCKNEGICLVDTPQSAVLSTTTRLIL